jgi:TM2 domain-containing membrane protein YozV
MRYASNAERAGQYSRTWREVMILLAILLPPLAVFVCGKPIQGIINLGLYFLAWIGLLFFIIPGVILYFLAAGHAVHILNNRSADKRAEKIANALLKEDSRKRDMAQAR